MFHASKRIVPTFIAGLALASVLSLGYDLARVRADGVPKAQPLWYSGTVADASGKPLDATYSVSLRLFERQEPQAGEVPVCSVESKSTRVSSGRFRIDASDCVEKLRANPDLFSELSVSDGASAGKPFARAKIGAVPFALEAQHAVSASEASPQSALELRLAKLELRSGFRAANAAAATLGPGWTQAIKFQEQFDLSDEYDPATGIFKPKQTGVYVIACQTGFGPAPTVGKWWTGLFLNGSELLASGNDSVSGDSNRSVSTVMKLDKGATVSCGAYFWGLTEPQNLQNQSGRLSFSASLVQAL